MNIKLFIGAFLVFSLGFYSAKLYFTPIDAGQTLPESIISDPLYEYVFAERIKEKLDSTERYSDSLILSKIRETIVPPESFRISRVDSVSYEIIVRPFNFNESKDNYFLVTQDSIYMLEHHSVK